MAKLYFKQGPMKSGKTRDLMKTWYNYTEKGMNAIIIKPGDDKKAGNNIQTRANEEMKVDYVVPRNTNIYFLIAGHLLDNNLDLIPASLDCIIVDEAQFLTEVQVDELSDVVDNFDIPVLCYGLRADAFTHLFPGSKRLLEVADVIEELKAVCKCGEKATHNIRYDKINGELIPVFSGPQIAIDGIDSYYDSGCRRCYKQLRRKYEKKKEE